MLGQIVGLSETGLACTTDRPLCKTDRLCFHGRFFSEEVRAEVRAASVCEGSAAGEKVVGRWFAEIDGGSRAAIGRVLEHAFHPGAPISYADLRVLSDRTHDGRRGGVRCLLHRLPGASRP